MIGRVRHRHLVLLDSHQSNDGACVKMLFHQLQQIADRQTSPAISTDFLGELAMRF